MGPQRDPQMNKFKQIQIVFTWGRSCEQTDRRTVTTENFKSPFALRFLQEESFITKELREWGSFDDGFVQYL